MAYYPTYNVSSSNPASTYQNIVQVVYPSSSLCDSLGNQLSASLNITVATASYFSGSISNAISASYSLTASYAVNGGSGGGGTTLFTASTYQITSSNSVSSSYSSTSSNAYNLIPQTSVNLSDTAGDSFYAISAESIGIESSLGQLLSFTNGGFSGSVLLCDSTEGGITIYNGLTAIGPVFNKDIQYIYFASNSLDVVGNISASYITASLLGTSSCAISTSFSSYSLTSESSSYFDGTTIITDNISSYTTNTPTTLTITSSGGVNLVPGYGYSIINNVAASTFNVNGNGGNFNIQNGGIGYYLENGTEINTPVILLQTIPTASNTLTMFENYGGPISIGTADGNGSILFFINRTQVGAINYDGINVPQFGFTGSIIATGSIISAGNVGIGQSIPVYNLDVNGLIGDSSGDYPDAFFRLRTFTVVDNGGNTSIDLIARNLDNNSGVVTVDWQNQVLNNGTWSGSVSNAQTASIAISASYLTPTNNYTASNLRVDGLQSSNLTVTSATPILNLTQTWNNSSIAFEGIKINIIPTEYAITSKYFDIQKNGSSLFSIDENQGVYSGTAFTSDIMYSKTSGLFRLDNTGLKTTEISCSVITASLLGTASNSISSSYAPTVGLTATKSFVDGNSTTQSIYILNGLIIGWTP